MTITKTKLILLSAIFFISFDNSAFFAHLIEIYPITLKNIGFLVSLTLGLTSFTVLLLSLLSFRYTTKPVLISLLLLSSFASYFMNNYNVVIDHVMIQNMLQTDLGEAGDLFSLKLLYYFLLLGFLPSSLVFLVKIKEESLKRAVFTRLITTTVTVLFIFSMVFMFSKFYTSFFREHKPLRYYTNPIYYLYSMGKYINRTYSSKVVVAPLGQDAYIPETDVDRELIILVVGEAVRADRLSLNGYERLTNPLLQKEDVVSFSDMYSCGTSTSYSVPCMFSIFPRGNYSDRKGASNENLLDVLHYAGVNVLWRDNNSDSKGVALRVETQNYKLPENNPICDEVECRDEGMLVGLQDYIEKNNEGDILIVLHQMGNHGPAYYKRYPKEFEKFTPVCRTNQFDECTTEEINNAYDNTVLYTDYFLSKVIQLLKNNSANFETAMVYLSDHGESLGEKGIYLHGLPYIMAPEQQKHVGSIFWFGNKFKLDRKNFLGKSTKSFSQDNLFHTILGMMEVKTSAYDKNLDIITY